LLINLSSQRTETPLRASEDIDKYGEDAERDESDDLQVGEDEGENKEESEDEGDVDARGNDSEDREVDTRDEASAQGNNEDDNFPISLTKTTFLGLRP
jgi:hypothetical protein